MARDFSAILVGFADTLRDAKRFGAEVDEPEGSRVIKMTDTLAVQLEEVLRLASLAIGGNSRNLHEMPEAF